MKDDFVEFFRVMALTGTDKLVALQHEAESIGAKVENLSDELDASTAATSAAIEALHAALEHVKKDTEAGQVHVAEKLATLEAGIGRLTATIADSRKEIFAELEHARELSKALRLKLGVARAAMETGYGGVQSAILRFRQTMERSRQELRSGLDTAAQAMDSLQRQIDSSLSRLTAEVERLGQAMESSRGEIENRVQDMLNDFVTGQNDFRGFMIDILAQDTIVRKKEGFLEEARRAVDEDLRQIVDSGVNTLLEAVDEAAQEFNASLRSSSKSRTLISTTIDQLEDEEGLLRELIGGAERLARKFDMPFP